MEAAEYDKMFAVEDRHFWFRGKRAWIAALLDRHLGRTVAGPILDVGCGTGANLQALAARGTAFGADRHPAALERCRQRGLAGRLVASSANSLAFGDGRFALVCLLDVLYHRDVEPVTTLREVRRVLVPAGCVLVTDSAMPALASPHDEAVWGRERFTRRSLRRLLEDAGFEIVQLSYANCALFPAVAVARWLQRRRGRGGSGVGTRLPWGNGLLYAVLRLEAGLLRLGLPLPWGSSIVCLARRVG